MAALPMRTWESIMIQAGIKKIVRDTWLNTGDIPKGLAYADVALLKTLGHEYPYKVKNLPYLHMHQTRTMISHDDTLMLTRRRNLYK
jgi:hypothetical protein